MKFFGLIAVAVLVLASCQKEDLRPQTTPVQKSLLKCETTNEDGTTTTARPGGGIVDPNADQDASTTRNVRKGK